MVPPEAVIQACPLLWPQLEFTVEGVKEIEAGSEIETEEFAMHPFASVIVTVKLPEQREDISSEEEELLQL